MGYRSDVTCVMYSSNKAEQAIINEWVRQRIEGKGMEDYFQFEEGIVIFEVSAWKWYDTYEEIIFLEKMFQDFNDTFCQAPDDANDKSNYNIEFARIGEGTDDIEYWDNGTQGYSDNRIRIQRSISID